MKTSKLILSLFACLLLLFSACQKDENAGATDPEATAHSEDQARFDGESDNVANDANIQVEALASFSGRQQDIQSLICGATIVVDIVSNPRTITITYNDSTCALNRRRSGVVVLSMPQGMFWKDAGAQITANFQNLKVTRISDNKSITLNGTQIYTNVSGGLLVNLATAAPITHTITSSNMAVTFDNGTQRTWNVAKQRVFTYNNGIVITASGTHTEGSVTNVAEWGLNRFGKTFTTSTVDAMIVRQDCNFRLTAGQLMHKTPNYTATAQFGLNSSGNPTSCPGTGAYYYRFTWTGSGGTTFSTLIPY